jgi:hypothetical protein
VRDWSGSIEGLAGAGSAKVSEFGSGEFARSVGWPIRLVFAKGETFREVYRWLSTGEVREYRIEMAFVTRKSPTDAGCVAVALSLTKVIGEIFQEHAGGDRRPCLFSSRPAKVRFYRRINKLSRLGDVYN